jgi:hypothetical protein
VRRGAAAFGAGAEKKSQERLYGDRVAGEEWCQEVPQEFGIVISHNQTRRRTKMANPRQEDKSTQNMEDTARRTSERAAEQTSRIGQAAAEQTTRVGEAAAEAGEEVARAGAHLLKQNAETLQGTWRSGLDMATAVMGRSAVQLRRTLDFSGNDALEQSFDTLRMTRDQQRRIAATTAIGLNALKPMLQFHVSLLRLWADNIEMLARNCEKELKTFTFEAKQQEEVEQQGQQRAA